MNKAIILLSGGLDSVVSLASIKDKCSNILALTFDYGQKSFHAEKTASECIAKYYSIEHRIVDLEWLAVISNSALTTSEIVPFIDKNNLDNLNTSKNASNAVWVPNRNGLFINIAGCFADSYGFDTIVLGANKEESANFKDNSKEFILAVNESLRNSVNTNVEVVAPLLEMTKEDIVRLGIKLNVPFKYIYSCYLDNDKHCGMCESCQRLKRALELNNRQDIIEEIFSKE